MLTGRKLYTGRMPFEIGNRHLKDPIPLPDPQVPPEYEPFLRKALAKKPDDRYQSAQEMLQAFKAIGPRLPQTQAANVRPAPAPVDNPTTALPVIPASNNEALWHREKSAPPAVAPSSQEARWLQEKGAAVPSPNSQEVRWQQEKNGTPPPTSQEARWLQEKGAVSPNPTTTEEAQWLQEKGANPVSSTEEIGWGQGNEATRMPEARRKQENEATRIPPGQNEARWLQEKGGTSAPAPHNEARWLQEKGGGIAPNTAPPRRDEAYERYSRDKAYPAPPGSDSLYPPLPTGPGQQRSNAPLPDEARWLQEKGGAAPQFKPANYGTPPQGYAYGQAAAPPIPGQYQPPLKPATKKQKQPIWLLAVIGLLVIGIVAVGVAIWLTNGTRPNTTPTVQVSAPTVTGGTGSTTIASGTGSTTIAGGNTTAITPGTDQRSLPGITPSVAGTAAATTAGSDGTGRTPPVTSNSQPIPPINGPATVPLSGHAGPVNAVSWSNNGLFYLTASDDKTLKIWDTTTNKLVKTLDDKVTPINDRVLSAVFSNDGQLVVLGIADKSTRIYSVNDRKALAITEGSLPAPASISPDQTLVPFIGAKTIRTWDLKKNNNGPEFPYFDSKVSGLAPTALAFSPDNATLALGLNNGRIILYSVATGQPLIVIEPEPNVKNGVRLLAWYSGGTRLAVGREKSFETLAIDLRNKLALPTTVGQALTAPVSGLNISADSKRLAVSSQNGELQVWSLENNQLLNRLSTGSNPVIGLHWSQDDQQITVATGGGSPALNTFSGQPNSGSLKVGLNPQNGTKVTGSMLLTELPGGSVRVTLDVTGLDPGQHKVHIHVGTCTNQGDIKFDLETLRTTTEGKATSTTVIKVDYTTLTTGSFYINVHNDPGTDTYIASCGEIHV